jgi:hypothetical protein
LLGDGLSDSLFPHAQSAATATATMMSVERTAPSYQQKSAGPWFDSATGHRDRNYRRPMDRLLGAIFGLVFVAVGTYVHAASALVPAWRARAALEWTPATCTIHHSELIEGRDSDGDPTYRVDVRYTWVADGQTHAGDRVDFSPGPDGDDARDAARRFVPGARVPCWHDPDAPGEAVLVRGGVSAFAGLFALPFQLAGLAVLYGTFGRPNRPRVVVRDGRLHARPRWGRRLATGGGALAVALELGLTAFAMVALDRLGAVALYAVVAAVAAAVAAHQLGQVLTALRLEIAPTRLALGDVAELRWRMRAPFGVGRGRVRLIGRERVWRGHGSDARQTERILHEAMLAGLDGAHARAPVAVRLPRASLPTLEHGRASVDWVVAVHAELPRWPDLDVEVPIEVAPVAVGLPRRPPPRRDAPALDGGPRVVLDRADAPCAPGAAITGVIGWTSGAPDTVHVELRRRIGVVGGDPPVEEVIERIDVATLPRIGVRVADGPYRGAVTAAEGEARAPLAGEDLRELWLVAPGGPVTWRSAQVEVLWRLALIVDGEEVASERIDLVDDTRGDLVL